MSQFLDILFLLNNGSPGIKGKFCFFNSLSWQCRVRNPKSTALKLVALASASSVSGSGAEYSEGLLDGIKKRRRKQIAGIDQDELVDPAVLADPDSCFCEFNGVKIHYKVYDAAAQTHDTTESGIPLQSKRASVPMILLHGFGASVWSWNRAIKRLVAASGSKVLAFHRPAFGLTSRVTSLELSLGKEDAKPLNPYSMAFSVLATLYFMNSLAAERAVLVGHSAGCLVAVNTYFEAPERIAALILVAPAIFSPNPLRNQSQSETENQLEDEKDSSNNVKRLIVKIYNFISGIAKYFREALMCMVRGMGKMLTTVYKRVLLAILRSAIGLMLIRMVIDKFGVAAVKIAWHDQNQVSEHILQGYTKPLRSKGWDRALVEFTAATLVDTEVESRPPLAKRLGEISCPVLIITGDNDRIVPSWNAARLSKAIPGSILEVIKHCGHLPHEEKVEEFASAVERFLQRAFDASEEQQFQQAVA